jgi:Patatin-like phospholipase
VVNGWPEVLQMVDECSFGDSTPARTALLRIIVAVLIGLAVTGCADLPRQPQDFKKPVGTIVGFDHVRYYMLDPVNPTIPDLRDAYRNEAPDNYVIEPDGQPVYNYLAVSGGGSAGAFGAGILNGWTKEGSRPKFKIVTGVSTGSLIAPFAFLGKEFDEPLKESYTTIDASKVYSARGMLSLLWNESLADNAPFKAIIEHYVDDAMLEKIAAEHATGRRLYVLSTDLDRQQPVIWDMGAIASSPSKDRLALFRQVLLASTAVPAAFPPVLIDVTVDGQKRDELHVDGGVFAQSFFVGSLIDLKAISAAAHPEWTKSAIQRLYVVRNGRIDPVGSEVKRSLGSISANTIGALMKVGAINDLYRLYLGHVTGELELRYVALPIGYEPLSTEEFNQEEMIKEYNLGYEIATQGIPWLTTPPGYRE